MIAIAIVISVWILRNSIEKGIDAWVEVTKTKNGVIDILPGESVEEGD